MASTRLSAMASWAMSTWWTPWTVSPIMLCGWPWWPWWLFLAVSSLATWKVVAAEMPWWMRLCCILSSRSSKVVPLLLWCHSWKRLWFVLDKMHERLTLNIAELKILTFENHFVFYVFGMWTWLPFAIMRIGLWSVSCMNPHGTWMKNACLGSRSMPPIMMVFGMQIGTVVASTIMWCCTSGCRAHIVLMKWVHHGFQTTE